MQSKIGAGIVAGLVSGVVFGIMMQMMTAPTPEGGRMSMMVMIAMVVRSQSAAVGWAYHLFNSALFGAIFAWMLDARVKDYRSGAIWGLGYGVLWWVLGALILMPILLGMPAFASLRMPEMRPVAMGSLVGHLIWGVILGAVYVRLQKPRHAVDVGAAQTRA